jgi:hypothetical protein
MGGILPVRSRAAMRGTGQSVHGRVGPDWRLPDDRERKRTFAGFRSNAVVRPTADIRDTAKRLLGNALSAFTLSARIGGPRLDAQCLNGAGGWRTMIFRGRPGLSHSAITVIRRRSDHVRSARVLISVSRLK